MYDDYDKPAASRAASGRPMACPVSTAAAMSAGRLVLTHAALGKRRIGLVGIDLGLRAGHAVARRPSISRSSSRLLELGKREAFHSHRESVTREMWFSDPAFTGFRESFSRWPARPIARPSTAPGRSSLSGDGVITSTLDAFLGDGPARKPGRTIMAKVLFGQPADARGGRPAPCALRHGPPRPAIVVGQGHQCRCTTTNRLAPLGRRIAQVLQADRWTGRARRHHHGLPIDQADRGDGQGAGAQAPGVAGGGFLTSMPHEIMRFLVG